MALLFTLEFQYLHLPSWNREGEYRVNNKLKHFCATTLTNVKSDTKCKKTFRAAGLKITAGQQTMTSQKRLCQVKSLDDRTFSTISYASNVIQTFTFFKYDWSRLAIIDIREGKK